MSKAHCIPCGGHECGGAMYSIAGPLPKVHLALWSTLRPQHYIAARQRRGKHSRIATPALVITQQACRLRSLAFYAGRKLGVIVQIRDLSLQAVFFANIF